MASYDNLCFSAVKNKKNIFHFIWAKMVPAQNQETYSKKFH